MNEEVMNTEMNAAEAVQEAEAAEAAKAEPVAEPEETMADFASELEASYKEFDERHNDYQEQEGPDAQKWANLLQMMQDIYGI